MNKKELRVYIKEKAWEFEFHLRDRLTREERTLLCASFNAVYLDGGIDAFDKQIKFMEQKIKDDKKR